jgi:ABC-type polysaccharide/polyol phosphate export permease
MLEAPLPEHRYRRKIYVRGSIRELWLSRTLIRTLAERDFRVRYKQATLGFAWAIFAPLALMVLFNVLFQRIARVDTGGVPYPLFSYLGILPWSFFSTSLSSGGMSIVTNKALLNKVYCPREVFPLASVSVAGADTLISGLLVLVLFVRYGFVPGHHVVWVPLILLIWTLFTIGSVLIISAVLVYARDLRHALPILLQLGLFATPVAYKMDEFIPVSLQPFYAVLNPLAPVIEALRSTVLYGKSPELGLLSIAAVSSLALFFGGYAAFKRMETRFADVA